MTQEQQDDGKPWEDRKWEPRAVGRCIITPTEEGQRIIADVYGTGGDLLAAKIVECLKQQQEGVKRKSGTCPEKCPKCSAEMDIPCSGKFPEGVRWWLCGTGTDGSKVHQSPKCRIAELEAQLASLQSPTTAHIDLAGIAERCARLKPSKELPTWPSPGTGLGNAPRWSELKTAIIMDPEDYDALLAHISRLTAALAGERERCAGLCEQLMNFWPDERLPLMRAAVEIRNGTVNVAGSVANKSGA